MITIQKQLGAILVGLYAWFLAVVTGMVLVDILYARTVPAAAEGAARVSDLLLLVGLAVLAAAVMAIAFAWKTAAARNLLVASVLVILLEFLIPVVISVFLRDAQALSGIGPWLRVAISGTASVLAFWGMGRYLRG